MTRPGRRLVLLRHGQTSWNAEGRAQGQADIELDDTGHEQAAESAPHVAALGPVALWTSDLARARQTCAYLEKQTGLVATHDARLREFDVGVRQGLTLAEFAAGFPDEHAAWVREDAGLALEGAESTSEVAARMHAVLSDVLAALAPGETGVVVTHGAALKVGLVALLGWPQGAGASLRGLDNCCWATLEESGATAVLPADGRLRLTSYNRGAGTQGAGARAGTPHAI